MKKTMLLLLMIILIFIAIPVSSEPTEDEIANVFGVSFQVYFLGTMMAAFGNATPGITINGNDVTYNNYDLSNLQVEENFGYKTVSGKISKKNENDVYADLKFTGGKVKKLEWSIKNFNMQQQNYVVDIIADGKKISFNPTEYQQ